MHIIVNVDLDWGIGRDGRLLVHLREDMRHFRALTLGGTIILGRKTLETFPGGKPLPDRMNLVLTRESGRQIDDALTMKDLSQLGTYLGQHQDDRVYVVGGASLYRQLLPFCSRAYVTRVLRSLQADAFFPDLDRLDDWILESSSPVHMAASRLGDPDDLIPFQFCEYRHVTPRDLADLSAQPEYSGYDD